MFKSSKIKSALYTCFHVLKAKLIKPKNSSVRQQGSKSNLSKSCKNNSENRLGYKFNDRAPSNSLSKTQADISKFRLSFLGIDHNVSGFEYQNKNSSQIRKEQSQVSSVVSQSSNSDDDECSIQLSEINNSERWQFSDVSDNLDENECSVQLIEIDESGSESDAPNVSNPSYYGTYNSERSFSKSEHWQFSDISNNLDDDECSIQLIETDETGLESEAPNISDQSSESNRSDSDQRAPNISSPSYSQDSESNESSTSDRKNNQMPREELKQRVDRVEKMKASEPYNILNSQKNRWSIESLKTTTNDAIGNHEFSPKKEQSGSLFSLFEELVKPVYVSSVNIEKLTRMVAALEKISGNNVSMNKNQVKDKSTVKETSKRTDYRNDSNNKSTPNSELEFRRQKQARINEFEAVLKPITRNTAQERIKKATSIFMDIQSMSYSKEHSSGSSHHFEIDDTMLNYTLQAKLDYFEGHYVIKSNQEKLTKLNKALDSLNKININIKTTGRYKKNADNIIKFKAEIRSELEKVNTKNPEQ